MIGEPLIGLPGTITFPDFGDPDSNPVLPVKTLLMLVSLGLLVATSSLSRKLAANIRTRNAGTESEAIAL